jgi:hypothetical protein
MEEQLEIYETSECWWTTFGQLGKMHYIYYKLLFFLTSKPKPMKFTLFFIMLSFLFVCCTKNESLTTNTNNNDTTNTNNSNTINYQAFTGDYIGTYEGTTVLQPYLDTMRVRMIGLDSFSFKSTFLDEVAKCDTSNGYGWSCGNYCGRRLDFVDTTTLTFTYNYSSGGGWSYHHSFTGTK